jgi:hypothetical protein
MNEIVDLEKDDLFSLMFAISCPLTNCNKDCLNYQFCTTPHNQLKLQIVQRPKRANN